MSELEQLFYWRGISANYNNYRGEQIEVSHGCRVNLLKAMGVDIYSSTAISEEVYSLDISPWMNWLPNFMVTSEEKQFGIDINFHPNDLNEELNWLIKQEGKELCRGTFLGQDLQVVGDYLYDGVQYTRRKFNLDFLDCGYYELRLSGKNQELSSTLAVVPATAYQPSWSINEDRLWGVIIQLYTLRSERNWGIGDFGDLRELIQNSAKKGIDVIGLNPLHALLPDVGYHFSPYSPSDRRFISPLYIDIEAVDDYEHCSWYKENSIDKESSKLIDELRRSSSVKYSQVKDLKYIVFESMYERFVNSEINSDTQRAQDFVEFVKRCGFGLKKYALYETANNHWRGAKRSVEIDPHIFKLEENDIKVQNEIEVNKDIVFFHCYLQWIAFKQLERCQAEAEQLGMKVGLIRDLAVGADGGGAEVSGNASLFCQAASVGAPPDPLAQQGQNWGLPPMDPAELRKSGYKHFIELLRTNMSLCGALRIDHAMSLMRLWWCPPGQTADQGAYVYYPFEELFGLLLLESQRNECVIIGEDLGVVPDEFREALTKARIFSNKVFYFEKESHDRFRKPADYHSQALAMVNNHDVPTLTSWWSGSDLQLRHQLNLFEEGVSFEDMVRERQSEKHQILNLLSEEGLLPKSWEERDIAKPADQDLIFSILHVASRASSKIFVIQLEDLMMMEDPVNVPGTFTEHPNWQRKLINTTQEIFESSDIAGLLDSISGERQRFGTSNH